MRGRKRHRKKARTLFVGRPRRRQREIRQNDAFIAQLEREEAALQALQQRLDDVFHTRWEPKVDRDTLIAALTTGGYEIVGFPEPGVVMLKGPRMFVIEGRLGT